MSISEYLPMLMVMVAVTYLVRALPFVLVKKKITSTYVRSFLHYVPFSVLSAMTIPHIFYSTGNSLTAACGFLVGLLLAWQGRSLLLVALASSITVFLVQLLLNLL